MNEDVRNIDEFFKNSIDGHLEEVPPDVWKSIDHGLDKKQAAFYKRRYFAVRAAAILLLLVGGVTIAAILHFHQHEKVLTREPSNQNAVISSNKRTKNDGERSSTRNEADEVIVQKKQDTKESVVSDDGQNKRSGLSNNTVNTAKKKGSDQYQSISSDTYSAQQEKEIAVAKSKNKSAGREGTIKYGPVRKSSVELIADRPNNLQQIKEQQKNIETGKTELAQSMKRTTHVDGNLLPVNSIDLTTVFPSINLANPVISLPVSNLPLPTAKKTRTGNYLKGWSISPMYAQNLNLNRLKDDDHFFDPGNNSREAKRTERETISFTAGLGVQKQVGRNISLQTGLAYFSSETNIEPKTIYAKKDAKGDVRFQFNCSSGNSYFYSANSAPPSIGDSVKTNFSKSELSYLQVPLLLSYQINFGRFSFSPSAGFQTNFLLNGKVNSSLTQSYGDEEVTSSIDGLRSMYLSGVIQPQLNYKLNDRISFDFNPNINFSLSPINKETAVQTYQNMISVGAGVRIKL